MCLHGYGDEIMEEKQSVVALCRRCGRKLKTDEAKERGMGIVCWKKSQTENKPRLFIGDTLCNECFTSIEIKAGSLQ